MKIGKKTATMLGLDSSNMKILNVLSSKPLLIAEIASFTEIPRTSLYYMLRKLEKRRLIERCERGKKTYWIKASDKDIHRSYLDALNASANNESQNMVKNISDDTEIAFYYGNKNVMNVFKEISELPPKARFYGIQPEQSIIKAITKNSLDGIIDFNKKINSKKLIVEGIIHEKGTDSMIKNLSKEDGERLLKSFANRSADTVKLPENFLAKTQAEIYMYDNKIAMINWHEEFGIIVKNKDMFDLVIEMFKSTKYLLEKYDQNEKIARKLIDEER